MSRTPPPSPAARIERVSRREREIMHAIFALGNSATTEEIRGRLSEPPGAGAVRIMLARLEAKGLVQRKAGGLRFRYSATVSARAAKRNALRQLVATFFGGSLPQMAASLVAEDSWSDADLVALRREIDRIREERKQES